MINFLSGKKTYLAAGLGVLVVLGYQFHIINSDTANALVSILGFSGIAFLRAGVNKVSEDSTV